MLLDNCPRKFKIDSEVLVDYNISKRDNLSPWNLRVSLTQIRRHTSAGFTEQCQAVQNCALNEQVVEEGFAATF